MAIYSLFSEDDCLGCCCLTTFSTIFWLYCHSPMQTHHVLNYHLPFLIRRPTTNMYIESDHTLMANMFCLFWFYLFHVLNLRNEIL